MSTTPLQQSTDGPSSAPDTTGSLPRDEVFELLSNERRRYTLHHLKREEGAVDLGPLAEQIAAWETDTPVELVSSSERKRVYTSLQQFHLPKMDEKGVVEFDRRGGTIELTERAGDLDIYLEVVKGPDMPWSQYYLGLAGVTVALAVAYAGGLFPATLLSGGSLGIFIATTFLISAAIHTYMSETRMLLTGDDTPPEVDIQRGLVADGGETEEEVE
jgi:hypothetical protein